MTIQFIHQVLIDRRVYGVGEEVEADEPLRRYAVDRGVAVEVPVVREAVSPAPKQARKTAHRVG
jgi:hypothetical protein